jgi:alkanesulfonate monooxygenase SsuD/methylene tetrahydromethanopterin reductase-like flavin-dependent oxidoreductase (luciferase family)
VAVSSSGSVLGSDRFGAEFSKTGEQLDDRARGEMLDEALDILKAAWSGEPVNHHGEHYVIGDVQFLPRPVQRPGVPVWTAANPGNVKPLRRAARCDGFFPVGLESVDQFAQAVAAVRDLRGDISDPYDTSLSNCLPAAMSPPTPRRAPRGG